ncbi:uncharacterized protein LOC120353123 [Nilaparvata lugens]|uniref:uncharacterized protein LOC120353123 n=1 Tax=Nilaparvata lugens TaxID=108931 RepID=UPI00193D190A|nr:uncharacterized protein LOC120353123 [Nilaparvata lugens]
MQRDIQSYCTPTVSSKRGRSQNSPEVEGQSSRKKTTMGVDEEFMEKLFQDFENRITSNIDEKLQQFRKDSQQDIATMKTVVDQLVTENKKLTNKLNQISITNKSLSKRVIDLEDRSRRNNLIFKGLKYNVKTFNPLSVVKNFCADYLGSRKDIWINRAHPLGAAKDNGPIIAHFPDDSDVFHILKNAKKLKGTGYYVHKDFSFETRKSRAKLFAMRKEIIKIRPQEKVFVNHDRITIGNVTFGIEETGRLKIGNRSGEERLREILGDHTDTVLAAMRDTNEGHNNETNSDEVN